MAKIKRVFALIDANAFYAECERAFRRDLARTPIVVLSSNDGNVIARSYDAKPFVKMGVPYFQIKNDLKRYGIKAFSSNYALYGDLSDRMMTLIESMVPHTSIYSIDECFADFTGLPGDLTEFGRSIRRNILRCTNLTVGVGIGPTKTLAKLANYTAKRLQAQTGGVVDITDDFKRAWVLRNTDVREVWGIGRRLSVQLEAMKIHTAMDLAQADPWMIRKKLSVVVERTARELAGTPCFELEDTPPPKQEICCSRSFGQRITDSAGLKEAVATYMARASEKLRAQGSLCKKIRVAIRTGMYNPEEAKFAQGALIELPYPMCDVRLMTRMATAAVDRIYRPGYRYAKAEVMLLDLCQRGEYSDDLFTEAQPASTDRLMEVLDQINGRWGRGTLRPAAVPAAPNWGMRRDMMSQSYTTRLDELWTIKCK